MGKQSTVIYLLGTSKVNFSNPEKIMRPNWLGRINTDSSMGKKLWSCLTRVYERSRRHIS